MCFSDKGALELGWLSNSNVCDWYRVYCNGNGNVQTIDFVTDGMYQEIAM